MPKLLPAVTLDANVRILLASTAQSPLLDLSVCRPLAAPVRVSVAGAPWYHEPVRGDGALAAADEETRELRTVTDDARPGGDGAVGPADLRCTPGSQCRS